MITMGVDENDFFRKATLRISSSLDTEKAMKRTMGYLKKYMPVDGMVYGFYDTELNIGKIIASVLPHHWKKEKKIISVPLEFWTRWKDEWLKGPKVFVCNDVETDIPEVREIEKQLWPVDTSHIRLKVELEKKRIGRVRIFAEGKNRYTNFHGHLISLLNEPFAMALSNILQYQEIIKLKNMTTDDNRYLYKQIMEMTGDKIIGADFGLKGVMKMVSNVAPMESPVLLMGETGVGKEVIANTIHSSSKRKDGPYIKVNCGAIPESLIDSELFGHEKGAFTGAISRKRGRFERAHNGTIFLDEIGELPLAAQVRLLRVLQQGEIERVGGTKPIPVNVRIISATHQNLEEMIRSRMFREDLWFRINVFPIIIPPLRHRTEDIPALIAHFIERKSIEMKVRIQPLLAKGALDKLLAYAWPGNVRELENIVERELILNQISDGESPLKFNSLIMPSDIESGKIPEREDDVVLPLDEMIERHIRKALKLTGGKVEGANGAAQMLKIHHNTLRGRMNKLGIPYGKKRT